MVIFTVVREQLRVAGVPGVVAGVVAVVRV